MAECWCERTDVDRPHPHKPAPPPVSYIFTEDPISSDRLHCPTIPVIMPKTEHEKRNLNEEGEQIGPTDFEERPGHDAMPPSESWEYWLEEIHGTAMAARLRRPVERWSDDDLEFLLVGLAGEVGELANYLKKYLREDFDRDAIDKEKLVEELGGVMIYLHLIAKCDAIQLDPHSCMTETLLNLRLRWPVDK